MEYHSKLIYIIEEDFIMKVIKRDGRTVDFDKEKIVSAVLKAFEEVEEEISDYAKDKANNIANYIESFCKKTDKELNIEEIQNLVEKGLMSLKDKRVAKAYILYRDKRTRIRNYNTKMMKDFSEKLNGSNIENQNANVDEHSFGGRTGEALRVIMKQYALDNCMSELAKTRHLNNEIYIHDLDSYASGQHNCLTIPFDDLLKNGFKTRQTDIRPASSLNTAFQLTAVIFQLQSLCQFGGCSASHYDWTMIPYVRKSFAKYYKKGLKYICGIEENEIDYEIDFMLKNTTEYSIEDNEYKIYQPEAYQYALDQTLQKARQGAEGLVHNLNSLQSRSGNQLPFTSINLGSCTKPEGRMITRVMLEAIQDGTGPFHRTSIFPCLIFQLGKGINRKPEDPNYDLFQLALKCTAQRLYPNYANLDWSGNVGYDADDPTTFFSTMGKRKLSSCKIF